MIFPMKLFTSATDIVLIVFLYIFTAERLNIVWAGDEMVFLEIDGLNYKY